MNALLVIKVTFLMSIILAGMNGCVSVILVPSLGPFKNVGNEMSLSIVASSGCIITRRTVRLLRTSELHSENEKSGRRIFDNIMLEKLGDYVAKPTNSNDHEHVPYSEGVDVDSVKLPTNDDPVMPNGTTDFENIITDQ